MKVVVRCGGSKGNGRLCGRELGTMEDDAWRENPRAWGEDGRAWFACRDHGAGWIDQAMLRTAAAKQSAKLGTVIARR